MSYDYSKLAGRIVEKCTTQAKFAEELGMSERTVSLKMNGKVGWKQEEMIRASSVLDFPLSDIPAYFFNQKVQS